MGEQRVVKSDVGRDCAAEVSGKQDSSQNAGTRNGVEGGGDESQDSQQHQVLFAIAQLDRCVDSFLCFKELEYGIH